MKRATAEGVSQLVALVISIHALVKRATSIYIIKRISTINFNPRPREKGDHSGILDMMKLIHFNPRPREKGDHSGILDMMKLIHFNPRPREKGDSAK